jgi:hypothetical protein
MPARFDPSFSFRHHSVKLALASLIPGIVIALVTFTVQAWWAKPDSTARQDVATAQPTPRVDPNGYIRRGLLRPQLRGALHALGDRLEKPGKERLTLVGTLRRQGSPQASPFRLFLELPHRMRLEEQGAQPRVIGFDGSNGWVLGAVLNNADREMIETLVSDSADHFFLAQAQGLATRALGPRFRLDDGTTPNYTGPFYDIYQLGDRIGIGSALRAQPKLFFFNSDTLLLERVRYQIERNGSPVKVEMQISGWQRSSGQQIQTSIVRLEGGTPVLTITVTSAIISQRQNDGIFSPPQMP